MTEWPELDDTEAIVNRRDECVEAVREHAGRAAYQLARFQGGEYGRETFSTERGEWTVKHEAGELQYLRFSSSKADTYVISTKQPPEPDALAEALSDYSRFVAAFNEHVRSFEGILDGVETEFPEIKTTDEIVAERERIIGRIREACDLIAGELHRYEGSEYGTFTARMSGTRWELKWEQGKTTYLRIGGSGGVYLISQYGPPASTDVREYAPEFRGFAEAYNEHVEDVESDLRQISL